MAKNAHQKRNNRRNKHIKRQIKNACNNHNLQEIIKILNENKDMGFNVNTELNSLKNTILHYIVYNSLHDMILPMINMGANVNSKNAHGATPLHWACDVNNENIEKRQEICKILLENKADINISTEYGETPLANACRYGMNEVVLKMLESETIKNCNDALRDAVYYCSIEVCHKLIECKANINRPSILVGHLNSIMSYETAQRYSHINYTEYSSKNYDVIERIIELKGNVNVTNCKYLKDEHPLFNACKKNETRIAKLMIDSGANCNVIKKNGITTPLILSCQFKNEELGLHIAQKHIEFHQYDFLLNDHLINTIIDHNMLSIMELVKDIYKKHLISLVSDKSKHVMYESFRNLGDINILDIVIGYIVNAKSCK